MSKTCALLFARSIAYLLQENGYGIYFVLTFIANMLKKKKKKERETLSANIGLDGIKYSLKTH